VGGGVLLRLLRLVMLLLLLLHLGLLLVVGVVALHVAFVAARVLEEDIPGIWTESER
jgi:hypothetical protein